jgi:hypothetical protein
VEQGARILLAIIFSGLMRALVTGGWTGTGGASAWFKAKFLGHVP